MKHIFKCKVVQGYMMKYGYNRVTIIFYSYTCLASYLMVVIFPKSICTATTYCAVTHYVQRLIVFMLYKEAHLKL